MMAIVKCERDSYGVYDFTDLLNHTSESFVEGIKWRLDFLTGHWSGKFKEEVEVLLDLHKNSISKVYIKRADSVDFYKYYGQGDFEKLTIQRVELRTIANIFNHGTGEVYA